MIKQFLLRAAGTNPVFHYLKHVYQTVRDWLYRIIPVDDNVIVFEAYRSSKYADSPRAIYEYMLNNNEYKNYKFIWVFEHPNDYGYLRNDRTQLVRHETVGYYVAFARAKYWVVNGWIPLRVQKKHNQIALQCWHGTPLKRLRYDIVVSNPTEHMLNAYRENDEDMMRYDALISPSKFTTRVFTSAFNLKALGKSDIIIETGYPRNDALVAATDRERNQFRKQYKIPKDKKVLLYAPTWRDDQQKSGGGYEYQTPVEFGLLMEQLSDEWVILFRAHNLVANSFDFSRYKGFVRDVSGVNDINELYIVSDALMTDYSSVFFDFANLRRPILFFMYDLDHYKNELRGFYVDLDALPGEIMRDEREVVEALRALSSYEKKYSTKYNRFNKTYNYLDDGKATQRVVDAVIKRDFLV